MTLLIRCAASQIETQVARHRANALMRALRRGPLSEMPEHVYGVPTRTPNAPPRVPFSPVFALLRTVQKRLDTLDRLKESGAPLEKPDALRYQALLREKLDLIAQARHDLCPEPQWPYVAGLYAVHVPGLRVEAGLRSLTVRPSTVYRVVTVDDGAPEWAGLSAALSAAPRGVNPLEGQPFRVHAAPPARTLQRHHGTGKVLSQWLLGQVEALNFDAVNAEAGDYFTRDPEVVDPWVEFAVARNDVA